MLVKEVMTTNVISCKYNQTVSDAAHKMLENRVGGLPIVDEEDHLVGIITESDFVGKKVDVPHALVSLTKLLGETFHYTDIEEIFRKSKHKLLDNVMTKPPYSTTPNASITDVENIMIKKHIHRLPVVDNGKLVGIITRRDILRSFTKSEEDYIQ